MSAPAGLVDAETLRQLLNYCPETGDFSRLVRTSNRIKTGDVAGWKNGNGYIEIRVLGKAYKAHRLAWLYCYGEWPDSEIDHIDGCRINNRISNLRDVPQLLNQQNLRRPKLNNASGFLGVSRCGNRWRAQINAHSKVHHIGLFDTPEMAHTAYIAAKRLLHPGNTL